MPAPIPYTEAEVRAMRDKVFGVPTTDNNWDACKDRWMLPAEIQWLEQQLDIVPSKFKS